MNLEELEKQVTLQEDIQEIENLQKKYGYYFDSQMFAEVIDLFSENTTTVEITDHGVFKGIEGVRRMYSGMIGREIPGHIFFEVMQSQGVITVAPDGKTATGRWYTPSFEARPFGGTMKQTWQFGVYDNEYIKENGQWYFKKFHWNLTYWTSFESGFLKVPKLMDTPFPHADAPASAYHPYPSGYHVPYPFPHPVTGE
ncbi:MAG: nuclear transport factor 2 family protein [Dehalococcoidales bacterium]|nr:nuclear transport factor 2 family protein [Dehalococcoidales bacterium]